MIGESMITRLVCYIPFLAFLITLPSCGTYIGWKSHQGDLLEDSSAMKVVKEEPKVVLDDNSLVCQKEIHKTGKLTFKRDIHYSLGVFAPFAEDPEEPKPVWAIIGGLITVPPTFLLSMIRRPFLSSNKQNEYNNTDHTEVQVLSDVDVVAKAYGSTVQAKSDAKGVVTLPPEFASIYWSKVLSKISCWCNSARIYAG
jgi:hypothetical protein